MLTHVFDRKTDRDATLEAVCQYCPSIRILLCQDCQELEFVNLFSNSLRLVDISCCRRVQIILLCSERVQEILANHCNELHQCQFQVSTFRLSKYRVSSLHLSVRDPSPVFFFFFLLQACPWQENDRTMWVGWCCGLGQLPDPESHIVVSEWKLAV